MHTKKSFPIDPVDLAKTSLFQGLEPAGLADVAHAAIPQRVQDGEYYFLQGDPANRVYVLVEGRVKLGQVNSSGQQVLMRMIAPWTLFGGVAMAQAEVYPVSAQAVDQSVALSWSKKEIMALIGKYPQLALNAMQLMAQNVQEFQERFRELATERVDRRLARTLLRLASHAGKKVPEGVLIDMPLTRQDLAEMAGTTLFTVSRTLSQWEVQGLVKSSRERVIIVFPHGLVSIAEDLTHPDST